MKFIFIILLFPLQIFAQDITGVWTGNLYNDTTKQYIHYELAISEYNGKLSGYSHTTFIIDSIENIGIKAVKIKQKDDEFLIEDEKLIYNNYPEPPAKGVKMFSRLMLSENDSTEVLSGSWNTNRTKEYSKLTGNIFLERKKKIKETMIVHKLEQMGLTDKLSFVPSEISPGQLASTNKKVSEQNKTIGTQSKLIIKNEEEVKSNASDIAKANPQTAVVAANKKDQPGLSKKIIKVETEIKVADEKSKNEPEAKSKIAEIAKTNPETTAIEANKKDQPELSKKIIKDETIIKVTDEKSQNEPTVVIKEEIKSKSSEKNFEESSKSFSVTNKKITKSEKKAIKENPLAMDKQKVIIKKDFIEIPPAAEIATRKIETIKTVEIKQDSLVLTLYDNGTVDGDTVSVLINGKVIWPKVGLLATATNKTIYLTPEMGDSIFVVMYAENLGSIPPNTGLLVVRDGETNYEIRFSGDLKKNSAIILKRKKKE